MYWQWALISGVMLSSWRYLARPVHHKPVVLVVLHFLS